MSSKINESNNLITPKLVLTINNKLRSLGIKSNQDGYRLLICAIKIRYVEYDENYFENFNVIYEKVSKMYKYSKTPVQIDDCIYYTINHRRKNNNIKENFKNLFGYEYDESIFTNKEFINEFVNILKINII